MPELIAPTSAIRESFLAAMAEYRAEGRGRPGDTSNVGHDIRSFGSVWSVPAEFERFVARVRAQALEDTPRPAFYVPTTTLWWVAGASFPSSVTAGRLAADAEYLGRVTIRHRLAPGPIGERNGHIGYDVRPSARRRGNATAMLAASLPIAADLGLKAALLTCDPSNVASRRAIERNGGVPADPVDSKLRFWVPTIPSGLG